MVEKNSRTVLATMLAVLGVFGAITTTLNIHSTLAISSEATSTLDRFGVQEIYPTKDGSREWYVNMDNPTSDPSFRNLNNVHFSQNADGSWQVSAGQIRMEAWSPENQKWQNVEMTEYAKIVGGSNELLQMYSRGGHHTSKDPCLGSAYKARLYGDGTAAWVKEVTHPAYAGNRGTVQATTSSLEGRWIGFKAVIYNIVGADGNTYVRMESYIDDSATDANGNLVISNNWKLASVVEDRGGWATHDSDFDSQCGRARDAILTGPGGAAAQNIAAFRSDGLTWDFKYLSVREIDPIKPTQTQQPNVPSIVTNDTATPTSNTVDMTGSGTQIENSSPLQGDCVYNMSGCTILANRHLSNEENMTTINYALVQLTRIGDLDGKITVIVGQEGNVLASGTYDLRQLEPYTTVEIPVQMQPVADVQGKGFDIVILTKDTPEVVIDNILVQSTL